MTSLIKKTTSFVLLSSLCLFVFSFGTAFGATTLITDPYGKGVTSQSTNEDISKLFFGDFFEMDQTPVLTPPTQTTKTNSVNTNCSIDARNNKFNYCMLAPIGGLLGEDKTTGSIELPKLGEFFAKIYRIGIMAAIALAIVMITLGGIRLGTTDSISGTEKGRDMIKSAIAGLLIALFSYVILYTINPELVLQTNNKDTLLIELPSLNK